MRTMRGKNRRVSYKLGLDGRASRSWGLESVQQQPKANDRRRAQADDRDPPLPVAVPAKPGPAGPAAGSERPSPPRLLAPRRQQPLDGALTEGHGVPDHAGLAARLDRKSVV